MEVLDLKSSETKEYNSENEAEKKGIADSIYLNKDADTGLAAPLSEPSHNEGVMRSEDSNKEESKYVVIDIVQESEEEADPIIRCCSCFSFFFPSDNDHSEKVEEDDKEALICLNARPRPPFGTPSSVGSADSTGGPNKLGKHPEVSPKGGSNSDGDHIVDFGAEPGSLKSCQIVYEDYPVTTTKRRYPLSPCIGNSGRCGDDLINEFKRPVKQVDLPQPKGS